ncbi:hypothetical protein ACFWBV_28455 [Streptomyces sp. NPDC060030]|uniref:hypothetical protein n=1 Tax=Streptomyces sp. NPDC060030 TaxID=3347042 RepID=UPI0036A4B94B
MAPAPMERVVYLAADTITYGELAETLETVLERPFRRVVWTVPSLLDELAADPDNMTRKYRAVFAQGRGVAWAKDDTYNARHAIPVTDLRQWVEENLAGRRIPQPLRAGGIGLQFLTGDLQGSHDPDGVVFTVLAAMSGMEREYIRDRTLEGRVGGEVGACAARSCHNDTPTAATPATAPTAPRLGRPLPDVRLSPTPPARPPHRPQASFSSFRRPPASVRIRDRYRARRR